MREDRDLHPLRRAAMNVRHEGLVHGITRIGSGVSAAGYRDIYAVITHCDEDVYVPFQEQAPFTADTVDCLACLAAGKAPWDSTSTILPTTTTS